MPELLSEQKTFQPGEYEIRGSFNPSQAASLDFDADASLTKLDTIIEADTGAGAVKFGAEGNLISVVVAGTAAYADSAADMGTVCTKLDSIIDLSGDGTLGVDGDDWTIRSVGISASGVVVDDDAVNKVVYVLFETGVSTVSDVETAIGSYGGKAAVKAAGTGANVLAAATDNAELQCSSGADQETISVADNVVTIAFETAVTTVTEIEALIAGLAGDDLIIKVKTAGTGANVLTAAGDTLAATHLAGGYTAEDSKKGLGFTVARSGTGTYLLTFTERFSETLGEFPGLREGTITGATVQMGDYDSSAHTFVIRTLNAAGSAADLNYDANTVISFNLTVKE